MPPQKFYDIMMNLPGFFKFYLFLRHNIYKKRHPRSYNFLPLKDEELLVESPNVSFFSDNHGIRVQFEGGSPASVLAPREELSGESPDIEALIQGDELDLTVGDQNLVFRFFEKDDWTKLEINHSFPQAFGLAEKHGSLDKIGKEYKIWNIDVASMEPKDDPLYKNYPLITLGKNNIWIAIILDYPGFQKWDMRAKSQISIHNQSQQFTLDVLVASDPKGLSKKIGQVLGKMELPPMWTLGYHQCRWSYFPADRVREIAKTFRDKKIPIDALYLDIDYMDGFRSFTYDRENFGDLPQLVKDLHKQHFKVITMIDPGLKKDENYHAYKEGVEQDLFVKRPNGKIYTDPVWPGTSTFPDFFNSKTREWWGQLYDEFVQEIGIDGWWNDMNEPSTFTIRGTMPDDVLHTLDDGSKIEHGKVHNLFGQNMVKASFQGLKNLQDGKRVFLLSRSAYLGSQKYGYIWSGDNKSAWSHLKESITKVMGTGLVGHFANGPDIGGFREEATPELFARWIQLGVFYPFMRTHYIKFTDHQEPWTFGKEVEVIARRMIRLRYELAPYIYTYFREGCETGIPLMRPMWMEFPNDEDCYKSSIFDSQFMFGPNLLIAPVVEKGVRQKSVYLPSGTWYDYFTKNNYQGGRKVTLEVPLDQICVLVKENSIIPVFKEAKLNMEQTRKSGIEYKKFGKKAEGRLYLDDGVTYDFQQNKFGLYRINSDLKLELIEGEGYSDN